MGRAATTAKWGLPITGGALVLMVQTPPEVAKSNTAKWVKELAKTLPDWPAWVDLLVTGVGLLLIFIGLWLWLRPRRKTPAPLPIEVVKPPLERFDAVFAYPPFTDRQCVALIALRDFLKNEIDPFIRRASKVAPWSELVRSSSRPKAVAELYVLNERVLPLAHDIAAIRARYRKSFDALGISLDRLLGHVEALVRPVEALCMPVWKSRHFRLPFLSVPLDAYSGQAEAMADKIHELEDYVGQFRAQVEPMLECLPGTPR